MSEPTVLTAQELSALRHELRTPLNHVRGYTEILLESAEEDGLDDLVPGLRAAHEAGEELLGLINAALSAGASEVRRDALAPLAEAIAARLGPLAEGVRALVAQAAGRAEAVRDLAKVCSACDHLGRLAATCLAPRKDEGGRMKDEQEADPSSSDSSFLLPPSSFDGLLPPSSFQGGRVLVVDDVEANRDLLCRRLVREGHRVDTAADGREALAKVRSGGHDLVLLDIMMPEVDGYEVLRQIKADAALRDLPVIMISALDQIASVVKCIEMGAEDYLPKPFDPVLLRARVGACLEKKRLRDVECEYLRGVAALEQAAGAVEAGSFDAGGLAAVSARTDDLGRLARVFERMAREVEAREQRLKAEVKQLRIEIDESRKAKQVEEITQSDYFRDLEKRAGVLKDRLRARRGGGEVKGG